MGNDAGISKFKYLSTIVDPDKYFTGYDAIHVIAAELVSKSIAVGIDSEQLRKSNYLTRYISYMTVIHGNKSDYIISFELDTLNIDTIEIVAFSTKDDNIRYHYKSGKEYDISDTIENEFLDEYKLIKEIVKAINNWLLITYRDVLVYLINPTSITSIITNKFASDFEE